MVIPSPVRIGIRGPGGVLILCGLATSAAGTGSGAAREAKILSASWGTDNAVGCPNGAQGLDNIPVTFSWFVRNPSIQTTDFRIVRSDGNSVTPTCALQFPPNESDERQTVNLIGDFGESVGDPNRCTVGQTFQRVMWSNGLTAYPTGEEVGASVVASYRAIYRLADGKRLAVAPLEVADLHDHETSFNADNMHDLCLPRPPRGATLARVTIAANLIQDPNGDPNLAQMFRPAS